VKRYSYLLLIFALSVIFIGCSGENDIATDNPLDTTNEVNRSQINVAEMVLITAGEVIIGTASKTDLTFGHEANPQSVFVEAFYIDKYEVTNAQYAKFLEATGYRTPKFWGYDELKAPEQPVVGVNWADAEAYARWAGKRLPTDIEWEKAARSADGRLYPWGNSYDLSRGNFDDGGQMDGKRDGYAMTPAPVGSFVDGISPYGLHDMAGNVWEWVASVLVEHEEVSDEHEHEQEEEKEVPEEGKFYTIRGGSWINGEGDTRTTIYYIYPEECSDHSSSVGFRCAKTP
jgi:formylglycine-generating enzyme required for sulfatase activity